MRSAFTMIELIFVILILAILSAVSLPQFVGTADNANTGVCKAFVGTLNRTVSHSIWSVSILERPIDYNVTEAKLLRYINEETQCGTLTQYVDAVNGTPFVISIGGDNYDVTGAPATITGPAHWNWNRQ